MRGKKGFTLIELMVVIIIVGILAAIVIPLLLSRVEKAKYSEGKTIAGQIATAVRAYCAEYGDSTSLSDTPDLEDDLEFRTLELSGKYFDQSDTEMTVEGVGVTSDGQVSFVITLTPNAASGLDNNVTLTSNADNDYDPTFSIGAEVEE